MRRLEPPTPEAVVRVEAKPGSEAQVDFGYADLTLDPATGAARKTWVFVMVLAWSRHLYAELVFDQRVATWLLCHRHAFEAFGGIPARIVPDNLKAAVARASFTEPVAQRAYRECAEHYGFLIDPNPPRSPHLKGKVEQGGVHYVARNFLAGRSPQPFDALNAALGRWCVETAGRRVHGTTRQVPLARFDAVERATLRPRPPTPYDPAEWKRVRVYRDCYLTFDGAYYSVPYRLVGQEVWARGGARTVEVYAGDHQLVATHSRAAGPGERQTQLDHLPPEKVPNLTISRETCRRHARGIGPATTRLVEGLLAHRPEDRLRTAGRLLRLAQRTSPERLERACARACAFGAEDYATVKRIPRRGPRRRDPARPGGGPAAGLRLRPPRRGVRRQPARRIAMSAHQLTPYLKQLRLSGILDTLDARNQQAIAEKWSYLEFLTRLAQDEVERRGQKQLDLRVRRSGILGTKTLEAFDFAFNPSINRQQVLDLATCAFVRERRNVLICGQTGVGKSHLAQGLAHEAARKGFDILFGLGPPAADPSPRRAGRRQLRAPPRRPRQAAPAGHRRLRPQAPPAARGGRHVRHHQ